MILLFASNRGKSKQVSFRGNQRLKEAIGLALDLGLIFSVIRKRKKKILKYDHENICPSFLAQIFVKYNSIIHLVPTSPEFSDEPKMIFDTN